MKLGSYPGVSYVLTRRPTQLVSLPADFLVWAASDDAVFLRNKFVSANWDVDELKARKEEIANGLELTLGLNGFPRAI